MPIGMQNNKNNKNSSKKKQQVKTTPARTSKKSTEFNYDSTDGLADNLTDDLIDEDEDSIDSNGNLFRIAVIAGGILGLIIVGFILIPKMAKPTEPVTTTTPVSSDASSSTTMQDDSTESDTGSTDASSEDSFVQGDADYEQSDKNQATDHIVDSNEFVKDLNGNEVAATYTVKSREYVKAHVSYVAKRAVIDDGMEMYWIDVQYKKKKYRVQVPFYYFKDFDDEGICRVEIEVLNLENGGQIISYMQVISEDDSDGSAEY